MTPPKKPGMAFWTTVVVVVGVLAYPLSFGPACWTLTLLHNPRWALPLYFRFCAPIIWAYNNGPRPIHDGIGWYAELVPPR